ncbi:hypothetical protein [Flavobacterium sp. CS20]|uniref:hypothetical protein n=1 Tax=Flavobacterium sp. CS20 TaxID=2775246 RepID=UPI001B3A1FE5|nr:hypothetical protein [Flavobacterium sp. CS20]QTY27882.1 hypothetical protein IGB25_05075 [Flavobacterium sp. CS20]
MKDNPDLKYFSVLSDLLLKSIRNQQTNVSKTLSDFFYGAFRQVREQSKNKPVVYPVIYYEVVYKAIEELAILKEKRNYLLEHRTAGEIWLLGELQDSEISEETYSWMWRNLLLAIRYKQDDLIMNHWETCHQYYNYSLQYIHEEYDYTSGNFQVSNKEIVEKRINERLRFIEFHYALGGLLTYKERYACLKRIFNYTQSEPPKYELLPESMYEIFKFYADIRDPYERKYSWISYKYPFPETSGIRADSVTKKWIMSYMAILFLRQYTIYPYLITMKPLDFPPVPNTQSEIKQWIEGLDFFKKLVADHLQNSLLLKTLNLDFITKDWCAENKKIYPTDFIDEFKEILENAYNINALNLPVAEEKVALFENSTTRIIEETFEKLQPINNKAAIQDDNSDKWYVSGQRMLQDKDAFSVNPEVQDIDFDSFLATIVSRSIIDGLGETFLRKTSQSYLLKPDELFKAIDNLAVDENYLIVTFGLNFDYFINHLKINDLSTTEYKKIQIHSFNGSHLVRQSLFVLRKSDLPSISTKPIDETIITKYSLKKISQSLNLFSSVIDMNNTSDDVFIEYKEHKSDDELRKSVLLSIIISTELKWKKNIKVIELRQFSEYRQKGIANKLDDVKPIDDEKPSS